MEKVEKIEDIYPRRCINCTWPLYDDQVEYCSEECKHHPKKTKHECKICGKHFLRTQYQLKQNNSGCCSQECAGIARSGSNHYAWRGGKIKRALSGHAWWKLADSVRERDDFKCKKCGKRQDGKLPDVHHITPVRLGGGDELNNLITLCSSCHMKETLKEHALFESTRKNIHND